MTAEIKRMLAERAAVESARRPQPRSADPAVEELLARIDRAAPFIDAGMPSTVWPPSVKLQIWFFVLATGPRPDARARAFRWAEKMLDRARRLFQQGQHPNPFASSRPA